MYTKGVSAFAARDLANSLDVPCFVLHDMDKNGFVMAAGFPGAVDIGLRMGDVEDWDLASEEQLHRNQAKAHENLLDTGRRSTRPSTFIEALQTDGSEPSSDDLVELTQFLQDPDDLFERIQHKLYRENHNQTWDDALWAVLLEEDA